MRRSERETGKYRQIKIGESCARGDNHFSKMKNKKRGKVKGR